MRKQIIPTPIKEAFLRQKEGLKTKFRPFYHKWLAAKEQYPKGAWIALIGGSLGIFAFLFVTIFYISILLT